MGRRIGLIGFGAIGQSIAAYLQSPRADGVELAGVCTRLNRIEEARQLIPASVLVTDRVEQLIGSGVELIIEAAGHNAVAECAETVLQAGLEFFVLSIGALADPLLRRRVEQAARSQGGRISIPAGALAGFDGLRSMREAGLSAVTYTSTKPPLAWLGTPAESRYPLATLRARTVIFQGTASQAALSYPKNANLAAAVAIAGIGFDATEVQLIADPDAAENTGRVVAESATATLELQMSSSAFGSNPKSSEITASSVISAVENRNATLRFV